MTDGPNEEERDTRPLYERVGGGALFTQLVEAFYRRVADDAVLRPLYPDELAPPAERLRAFLVQYFGGPAEYAALRGEPRLRLRHLPFPIDAEAKAHWLSCMHSALAECALRDRERAELAQYFESTAAFLVNRGGLALG